jgi:hypothetical protein
MAQVRQLAGKFWFCYCAVALLTTCAGWPVQAAQTLPDIEEQLRQVKQQNEALQQQLRRQQEMIDELNRKVTVLTGPSTETPAVPASSPKGFSLGKVRLSGEGAAGFFHSQSRGQFPNSEFRVDEAKLFVEAPLWDEAYFFGELNLFSRETLYTSDMYVGELFVDFENISRLWKQDRQLNLRLGRFDIPVGEEYLKRDAIDNPLVSHSIMDLWGVDEGLALYGSFWKLQYIAALQNGGPSAVHDFNSDKSIAFRLGYDPVKPLHVSVSAMRTGRLDVGEDRASELWIGSGVVRPLGSAATTTFEADVLQGDIVLKLPTTTLTAAGGVLRYDDNDPAANNRREVYYYSFEAVQRIYRGAYAAARWSQAFAEDGFPLVANGDSGTYFNGTLTEDLWLLSLGLGYRWSNHLLIKAEYSFTRGHLVDGTVRDEEDLLSALVAFAF